ncbi:MAG: hypothetical protein ACT4PL_12770 [Phycisphaerales bacterium]
MSLFNGSITDTSPHRGSYSAKVELWLRVGERRMELAQVGHSRMYFDAPVELPEGEAELIQRIDGNQRTRAIRLAAGTGSNRIWNYTAI